MKPHLFLARAGYAIIWERFVMGEGTQTWVIGIQGRPVAANVEEFGTPRQWVHGSLAFVQDTFENWKASADFIPESEFKVCEVQGAFTAWEVEK